MHVQVSDQGSGQKAVSIKTPFGDFEVNKGAPANEATLGLPIYPGVKAEPDQNGGSVNMRFGNEAALHISAAKFHSSDDFEKVKKFYQDRLTAEVGPFTPGNIEIHTDHWDDSFEGNLVGTDHEGKTVYEIKRKDSLRIAALKNEFGGARIELVNIRHGKDEAN